MILARSTAMQHVKPKKLEDDGLPDLSEKEMTFALLVASGKSQQKAYREAYDNYTSTDKAISVMATRVRHRLGVSLWIDALKREHLSRSSYSIDDYMKELDKSLQMYAQAGAWSAHVAAVKAKGDVVKTQGSAAETAKAEDRDLLDTIEAAFGIEARRKAERQLGYPQKEHQTVQ
jgi:hypothetical protein